MNKKAGRKLKSQKEILVCSGLWIFYSLTIVLPVFFVLFSAKAGDFQLVFGSDRFISAIKNTALECLCSTVLSVLAGYVYAYAVVRANIPFKKFFAAIPVLHMVTPPFVGGLSFILLFGRQGFITKTLFGLDVSLYGFTGLLISQVLCFFPTAYLICSESLRGINPSVEQAARSMGAGRFKIFKSVTLPLSFTGIASSALFIAASVLSDFGNPLIVGGRFKVLAVEIYTQLTGWLDTGVSAVLALILLVPSVILFIAQNSLFKKNIDRLATIGSKGTSGRLCGTSRLCDILLTVFVSLLSIIIIAQLISIVAGSFQKLWGINTSLTLDHFKGIRRYVPHVVNSVLFAFAAAFLATVLSAITAYFVHRTDLKISKPLDVVCQIPAAIPGTLLGLALAYSANRLHFNMSVILIIVAMTVSYLPFAYRISSSTFSQLKMTLDDAGRSLGASRFKVLSSIIFPLSSGGLFSSFMYAFARGTGTLSSVIFLVSFNTSLASVKILNLAEQGDWGKSAALALVLTLITFIILGAGKLISRRFDARIYE